MFLAIRDCCDQSYQWDKPNPLLVGSILIPQVVCLIFGLLAITNLTAFPVSFKASIGLLTIAAIFTMADLYRTCQCHRNL